MTCVHRWRLSEPNGNPTVEGHCRLCGARRDFPAAFPEVTSKQPKGRR